MAQPGRAEDAVAGVVIASSVRTEGTTTVSMSMSECERCLFRLRDKLACVAFPRGIPVEIADGQVDHTHPYPGDGGFRFNSNRPQPSSPAIDRS